MIQDRTPSNGGAFAWQVNKPLAKVQVAGAVADFITLFSSFDAYEAKNDIYTEVASFDPVPGRPGMRVLRATGRAPIDPRANDGSFSSLRLDIASSRSSDWHKCTEFCSCRNFDD